MKFAATLVVGCLLVIAYAANAQVGTSEPVPKPQHQPGQHSDMMMMSGDMQKDMQMMNKMMTKHLGKSDRQYDARFIDMMIPHHEGAVMMAKDALKSATHQEIKDMAAKMIKDQQKEIEQLKQWRQQWYGDASRASETKRIDSP